SHLFKQGWKFGSQPRRLLTFSLDGEATLPPTAPPDKQLYPIDDPTMALSENRISAGQRVYSRRCSFCHGRDLVSIGSPAPDLREATIPLNAQAFRQVVKEGAFITRGMPRFDQ